MKVIVNTVVIAACAALIGGIGAVPLVWAQQPSTTPAPQAAPAQPGPGMGQQIMQKGMDHGAAGQNMVSGVSLADSLGGRQFHFLGLRA